ncbi:B12-binding domain-containing radical SAM protein, partial [bacterium]
MEKPGRYIGGELNQIVKDWEKVPTRVLLAFPDIYDIGLPNLGLMILYDQINQLSNALAERTYAPWIDMEKNMRENAIPLYSLESKRPAVDFDILAFTLPYESIYTNILNMLDLAEIPLRSSERNNEHPLIIAGGHAAYNPEPMAEFFDVFVIGDGEEIMLKIVDIVAKNKTTSRNEILSELMGLDGIYIPSYYQPQYNAEGLIHQISPL